MIKLYWAPQSRSRRALWLLEEAGRPYERVLIDIRAGAQSTPEYRAINPMMKVPALTDGPVTVAESGAIYAYVADRYPEAGLAPAIDDPRRGDYLRWLFFSAGCVEAAITQIFTKLEIDSSMAGWGSSKRVFDVIETGVSGGGWLLGDRFTAADIAIGSDLTFAMGFKLIEERPAFVDYVARCAARPAYRRALEIEAGGA